MKRHAREEGYPVPESTARYREEQAARLLLPYPAFVYDGNPGICNNNSNNDELVDGNPGLNNNNDSLVIEMNVASSSLYSQCKENEVVHNDELVDGNPGLNNNNDSSVIEMNVASSSLYSQRKENEVHNDESVDDYKDTSIDSDDDIYDNDDYMDCFEICNGDISPFIEHEHELINEHVPMQDEDPTYNATAEGVNAAQSGIQDEDPTYNATAEGVNAAQSGENDDFHTGMPLYRNAPITREQSTALILAFALRHNLKDITLAELLILMNAHLPKPVLGSKHLFLNEINAAEAEEKYFCELCKNLLKLKVDDPEEEGNTENKSKTKKRKRKEKPFQPVEGLEEDEEKMEEEDYYICTDEYCTSYNEEKKVSDLKKKNLFFLYVPLEQQLRAKLENPLVFKNLNRNMEGGVTSANIYKNLVKEGRIGENDVTLQWNTDGANAFKKSSVSIWPIQVGINELPYKIRRQHLMLSSLWFGKKPEMDTFLTPFVEDLIKLHEHGIKLKNGTVVKAHCLLSPVDSVARPLLQKIKQFNGIFGCSFCLHPGEKLQDVMKLDEKNDPKTIDDASKRNQGNNNNASKRNQGNNNNASKRNQGNNNNASKRNQGNNNNASKRNQGNDNASKRSKKNDAALEGKEENNNASGKKKGDPRIYRGDEQEPRTLDQHTRDLKYMVDNNVPVRHGIKGATILLLIPLFNIISGFTPDYLHCVLLGVVRMFLFCWLLSSNSKEPWYINKTKFRILNERLSKIMPPSEISRMPQDLTKLKFWKASELRAFLLYYSLPCLKGILPEKYYRHWALLVYAMKTFLKEQITDRDHQSATAALRKFVLMTEELYSPKLMVINMHFMLRIPQSVTDWGALWDSSTFLYEHNNGVLLKMFHGTQHIAKQIFKNYMRLQKMQELLDDITDEWDPYAEKLLDRWAGQLILREGKQNFNSKIHPLGRPYLKQLDLLEQIAVQRFDPSMEAIVETDEFPFWDRFIVNGIKCTTTNYTRSQRNNNIVRLQDGTIFEIRSLTLYDENYFLLGVQLDPKAQTYINHPYIKNKSMIPTPIKKSENAVLLAINPTMIANKCVFVEFEDVVFVSDIANKHERD